MVKQDLGATGFISNGRPTKILETAKETHVTGEEVSQNPNGSHRWTEDSL